MHEQDRHLTDQELLLALDHELSTRKLAAAERHLAGCALCQDRRTQFSTASEIFNGAHAAATPDRSDRLWAARAQLRTRMQEERTADAWTLSPPQWAMLGATALALVLLAYAMPPLRSRSDATVKVDADALPVARLTPGATSSISAGELCANGSPAQHPIPDAVRQQVIRNYGMENVPRDQYELDYLITPELGGAPEARNLWPQRYASRVWNAHVKDQLEWLLPQMVCSQKVALKTAQDDIARDWIAAYKKYFKTDVPVALSAELTDNDDPGLPGR